MLLAQISDLHVKRPGRNIQSRQHGRGDTRKLSSRYSTGGSELPNLIEKSVRSELVQRAEVRPLA